VPLSPKPVDDDLLVTILNSATLQDLAKLPSAGPRQLSLRLFALAETGSCIPHTHQVCAHHYYLAVSEFDELPAQAVFDLGTFGEFRNIRWMPDERTDAARLRLDVANYPEHALRANSALLEEVTTIELDISVSSVKVARVGTEP
jgi:hypothetical protein